MKVTYDGLFQWLTFVSAWFGQDEKNKNTKLGYALQRVIERAQKRVKKYNTKLQNLNADHCIVSQEGKDKGALLTTELGNYRFDAEGLKKLNNAIEALGEEEIEIEPYFATSLEGVKLTDFEQYRFLGFVLTEELIREAAEAEEQAKQAHADSQSI